MSFFYKAVGQSDGNAKLMPIGPIALKINSRRQALYSSLVVRPIFWSKNNQSLVVLFHTKAEYTNIMKSFGDNFRDI